jgi:hypothetical protein
MTDSLTTSDEIALAEDYLRQWKILGTGSGSIFPKSSFGGPSSRNYDLFNERTGLFLQHEKQTYGINLGWTDDAESGTAEKVRRWFFARSGGGDSPVHYGETIALANGGDPSFIRNAHRTVGVDLDWSGSAVYEWKILGGKVGDAVQSGDMVALYNVHARECLIHFDRTRGGDIGWPSSKTWGDQILDGVLKALKEHADDAIAAMLAA